MGMDKLVEIVISADLHVWGLGPAYFFFHRCRFLLDGFFTREIMCLFQVFFSWPLKAGVDCQPPSSWHRSRHQTLGVYCPTVPSVAARTVRDLAVGVPPSPHRSR